MASLVDAVAVEVESKDFGTVESGVATAARELLPMELAILRTPAV